MTAFEVSASSVRMERLIAPVARFATMKTGNMLKLIADKICDLDGVELPIKRARREGGKSSLLTLGYSERVETTVKISWCANASNMT